MSVSSKVGLLILVIALALLATLSVSVIYAPTVESRAALLSSLVTSLTLLVLIWERLREFSIRKLDFLNRRALSPTLKIAAQSFQGYYWGQEETFRKATKLLKRRGKYLGITLYPKRVVPLLESAAENMERFEEFEKRFSALFAPNFLIRNLLIALDLQPRSNESIEEIAKYKEMARSLKGEETKFVEVSKKLKELMEGIRGEIGDFFEDNELEIIQETGLATYYRAIY